MTMTQTALKVGDTCIVTGGSWPGVWTVKRVNTQTYGLEQNGRKLRASKEYCVPAGDGTPQPRVQTVALRDMLPQVEGAIVRYVGRTQKDLKTGMLMVVIADKYEKVNVAPLGGCTNGGYYRMPYKMLEAVDPATWALIED